MRSVLLLLAVLLVALCASAPCPSVDSLIERLLPAYADQFVVDVELGLENNVGGAGQQLAEAYFHYSSAPCPQGHCVFINASGPVAAAAGLKHYLGYTANCSVSWLGDNLANLELYGDTLPPVSTPVYRSSPYTYRYYLNPVSFSYSMFSWDWPRWQREIDWMALNGVTTPLAFVGMEYVLRELFTGYLNISEFKLREYFTGPAYQAWNRFNNIQGWMGPLPATFIDQQYELQLRILAHMRSYGMKPVLPLYSGGVPNAFTYLYPHANVTLTEWYDFSVAIFLDPLDPMFNEIQHQYMLILQKTYGTDHLYSLDLFNEDSPINNGTDHIKAIFESVYSGIASADANATWFLSGWFFVRNPGFWEQPQINAVLSSVPRGRLIINDLYAEANPVWPLIHNTSFIWSELGNFGGRTGLFARLQQVISQPPIADTSTNGSMVGLGMTPEALESNPIAFDLLADMMWQPSPTDLSAWVQGYVIRRYAGPIPPELQQAWTILLDTVYTCQSNQSGTSASVFTGRPNFNSTSVGCCATMDLYYNASALIDALGLLLNAGQESPMLISQTTYQYDLTLLAAQTASNQALALYNSFNDVYNTFLNTSNPALAGEVSSIAQEYLDLLMQVDALMGTQPLFLFGSWLENATKLANSNMTDSRLPCSDGWQSIQCGYIGIDADTCELMDCCYIQIGYPEVACFLRPLPDEKLYTLNARTLLTLWGPQTCILTDYAARLMNGLLRDYYHRRWSTFFDGVETAMSLGRTFDMFQYTNNLQAWEENWTLEPGNQYMRYVNGSAYDIATEIYQAFL